MDKTNTPKMPENTVSITLSVQDTGELHCGFGWNIPKPESDDGNYLYVTGLGLLWMLTQNLEGLTRLGMTYEQAKAAEDPSEKHDAEILDFPITPTKH